MVLLLNQPHPNGAAINNGAISSAKGHSEIPPPATFLHHFIEFHRDELFSTH